MRRDILIERGASLLSVSARELGGQDRASASRDLAGAAASGRVLPVALAAPGAFVVRIVEGPLNEAEDAEWVGRITGGLVSLDGVLRLETAFGPVSHAEGRVDVHVARGSLRVDLYTYLGGSPSGEACYRAVAAGTPLGQWFRQTRPGTEFPDWLALRCMEQPGLDPGFEDAWAGLGSSRSLDRTRSRITGRPALAFVLQVQRTSAVVPPPVTGPSGLIPATTGARLPHFCPRGLDATVGLTPPSELTDLPQQTESPDAVQHRIGSAAPGLWDRVRGWVAGDR